MSLYIPKLGILEKGAKYLCIRADGTVTNLHGEPLGVTAVEVPKHGRLIDADALEKQGYTLRIMRIENDPETNKHRIWNEAIPLDDESIAMTIIPADREATP